MQYDTGSHCVFYHRYHLVWSTKYRFKALRGSVRLRVRDICRQVCRENDVKILRGVLSSDHVHMFVSVPPKLAISDLVRRMKGRRSTRCNESSPSCAGAIGAAGSGGAGIFQRPTEPLPKTSYFSTWNSIPPIPPAPAGKWFSEQAGREFGFTHGAKKQMFLRIWQAYKAGEA